MIDLLWDTNLTVLPENVPDFLSDVGAVEFAQEFVKNIILRNRKCLQMNLARISHDRYILHLQKN